jgi:hypothetical protein
VINNPRDLLKMTDRVRGEKKGTLQLQNYSENKYGIFRTLYTHMNWHRNSHRLAHTSQISNMYSTSHTADVEMIIQFNPVSLVMAGTSVHHGPNSGRHSIDNLYFV